jgi:hypothetical protein
MALNVSWYFCDSWPKRLVRAGRLDRLQPYVPIFVNHITLRMPALMAMIAGFFNVHELLKDSSVAASTEFGKICRVMIETEHFVLVLIVAVLLSKDQTALRAREMVCVIFLVHGCDVRATKCAPTTVTDEIKASEVVCFA